MSLYIMKALTYNDVVVGYRVLLNNLNEEYDIASDTLKNILKVYDVKTQCSSELESVELVEKGGKLIPKGLIDVTEIKGETLIYKMGLTESKVLSNDLYDLYDEYNRKYFYGLLRPDVKLMWSNRLLSTVGVCEYLSVRDTERGIGAKDVVIKISKPFHAKHSNELEGTLIHEMIHVKYPREGHEGKFILEMNRLNKEYGLNVTVHTIGEFYKYLYKCTDCNKKYGRNRLLDTDRYVCSVCGKRLKLVSTN